MTDRATTSRRVRINLRSGVREGEPMIYALTADEESDPFLGMNGHADLDPGMAYDTWIDVTVTEFGAITSALIPSEPPTLVEYEPDDDDASDIADTLADETKASSA